MPSSRRPGSPLLVAIATGLLLGVSTLLVHGYLTRFDHFGGPPSSFEMVWILGGTFVFGALPAYASARYRLLSPVVLAVGIYGWALATSWSSMVDSARSPEAGLTPTVFEVGLFFWPMVLWIPLVVGALEYGLRYVVVGDGSDAET